MKKIERIVERIATDELLDGNRLSSDALPEFLYHATYKPLLNKIKRHGLGATARTFWEDSKPGVVYLADDPCVAESYAEANENCNEDWLDMIVVLEVRTSDLDSSRLVVDRNERANDDEVHTYEYHGIIPFSSLKKID